MVNLRQEISDGYVSAGTQELIKRVLIIELNEFHPNSWDKRFCEDILDNNTRKLSDKQSDELYRILDHILEETEHPSFTPKHIWDPE